MYQDGDWAGAATMAVVPIGPDGAICMAASGADTHFNLDAVGYVS